MDLVPQENNMNKIELLETQKHPKGNIKKGSIHNWNENAQCYEYKNDEGIIVSTVNKAGVEAFSHMFKKIN